MTDINLDQFELIEPGQSNNFMDGLDILEGYRTVASMNIRSGPGHIRVTNITWKSITKSDQKKLEKLGWAQYVYDKTVMWGAMI